MVQRSLPLQNKASNRFQSFFLFLYYILESIVMLFVPISFRFKDVKNQIILITGGGSGIGQLMALKFLKLGSKVVIWDVNANGMKTTVAKAKEQGLDTSQCICYEVNLCEPKAIYENAKRVRDEVGVVDILINNAGVVSGKNLLDIEDSKIELTFRVNTLAHFYTLKAFLPDMIQRQTGHIVTIASVAGDIGVCSLTDYCSSKFANLGLDYSLRMELAQANLKGIKTTIVKPYFITTGMFAGANPGFFPYLSPEYVARKVVEGVLSETIEVVLPKFFHYLMPLLPMFPAKSLVPLYDFLGGFEFMANFHGREAPNSSEINNNNLHTINNNILQKDLKKSK